MDSKELLKEFYYHSEQDCDNDWKLGCLNQAYQQIKEDLELLEALKEELPLCYDTVQHEFVSSVELRCMNPKNRKIIKAFLEGSKRDE